MKPILRSLVLLAALVARLEGLAIPAPQPDWTAYADQVDASFGRSIAGAGDVNGDGYDDVLVGAPNYKTTVFGAGAAFLYYGSADGVSMEDPWKVEGVKEQTGLGGSVAAAGDVNGDGYADVIIGAPYYDEVLGNEGRAYVYLGGPDGLAPTWAWSHGLSKKNALFGWSVAGAGDVNGDGFDDVIIGAKAFTNGQSSEGAAFVFHGDAEGLSDSPGWSAEGNATDAWFGYSVASAGDLNKDGYGDVIVGAPIGPDYHGGAYVYHGSLAGLNPAAAWTADNGGGYSGGHFGQSVASAGDFNGDGVDDVIVGEVSAYDAATNSWDQWKAHVFFGIVGSKMSTTADRILTGVQVEPSPDIAVTSTGDFNRDGIDDVAVGIRLWAGASVAGGGVFVYHGRANGPQVVSVPDWSAEGVQAGAQFGAAVAWGDVNGDFAGDLLVGAPWNDYGGQPSDQRSAAFAFHGLSKPRPAVTLPAQLRLDGTTEIPAGGTTSEAGFIVRARVSDPAGRPLRLQVEVKESGTPFSGLASALISSSEAASASTASATFSDLSPGKGYHWRARAVNDLGEASSWIVPGSSGADLSTEALPTLAGGSASKGGCGGSSSAAAVVLLPLWVLIVRRRVG